MQLLTIDYCVRLDLHVHNRVVGVLLYLLRTTRALPSRLLCIIVIVNTPDTAHKHIHIHHRSSYTFLYCY